MAQDIVLNVLGYLPLGLLTVFALYPRIRGIAAVALATLFSVALSGTLEALQTYLPTRDASKLDLLTNIAGALIGAILAVWLEAPIHERGRLRDLYYRWVRLDAGPALVLLALWFGAITYPEPFALGLGGGIRIAIESLLEQFDIAAPVHWSTQYFGFAEAAVCTSALAGAGTVLLNVLHRRAPRLPLIALFVALTAAMKTLAQEHAHAYEEPFAWITAGAGWGFCLGLAALSCLIRVPEKLRTRIGFLMLLLAVVLTNIAPDNPYYDAAEHIWAYGPFANLSGLALGLSYLWPFGALWVLFRRFRVPVRRYG